MAVAVVTHCWATDKPQYAVFLRYQLSSLILNPPVTKTIPIVAYSPDDPFTSAVVDWFFSQYPDWLAVIQLTDREMWRRAIARNIAAQRYADSVELMWFTDCDYLFGRGCIDYAVAAWHKNDKPAMLWPRQYEANYDKSVVDALIDKYAEKPVDGLLTADFDTVSTPVIRAIGGLQITAGTYAATHGYLPDGRWQKQPIRPFPDFRDDVAFRRRLEKIESSISVPDLPGLIRMRHTEVGYGPAV